MNPLDHLDKEALRKIREYERLMSQPGYRKLVEELTRTPSATQQIIDELTRSRQQNQLQLMQESLHSLGLDVGNPYGTIVSKIADQVVSRERDSFARLATEMATVIRPTDLERMAKEIAESNRDIYRLAHDSIAQVTLNAAKTINDLQSSLSPHLLDAVQAVTKFNDGPVRMAMETMRSLKLDAASPLFNEFINAALSQAEPLTKKDIGALENEHLSKKKTRTLSKKEKFDLMKLLAILTVLIALYSAWKMGQPVTIDPDQIAKLIQPPINITTVIQVTNAEPAYYLVMRPCELTGKPGKTTSVTSTLEPGTRVKLLSRNHQWIYVKDEKENKEGWVRKKYLNRLR